MQSFPKTHRLRKSREFLKVIRRGEVRECNTITAQILHKQARTRLGITVTKKFGKAHCRNRFKRQIREIFRTTCSQLPSGLWIHIRPKLRGPFSSSDLKTQFLQIAETPSSFRPRSGGSARGL